MNATISKNLYTNNYEVNKWDDNHNIIETFHTKKKHLAQEVFCNWYFGR